ncbi:hypothetical protein HC928_14020 [bacterium]|nr:hypothetical protein [bacterium]
MHEINTDYCKVVIEDRRKMATEFFYKQRVARSQRKQKQADGQELQIQLRIGVNLSAIRRSMRSKFRIMRRSMGTHAAE